MRNLLFRFRGLWLALAGLGVLVAARPTLPWLAAGFALSALGEALRLWAIGYAGEATRAQELRAPQLVTAGPYSVVRNPLYVGNLLTIAGVALAAFGSWNGWAAAVAVTLAFLAYRAVIGLEEDFLRQSFGEEFESYRQTVPALVPRSLRTRPGQGRFSLGGWKYETSSLLWLAVVWGALLVRRGTW